VAARHEEEAAQAVTRWLGLWRPVVGRARSDWPFLVAVWLLVVSAVTLLAAGSLYSETVESGGVRRALLEAAPGERGVAVRLSAAPAELDQLDANLREVLENTLGRSSAQIAMTVRSPTLRPALQAGSPEPEPAERRLVVLGSYESLADHATLAEGRWPEAGRSPVEVALHSGAADALGVTTGDSLPLADASAAGADPTAVVIEVLVVGVYGTDRQDPYWLGSQLELTGAEQRGSTLLAGPLMAAREDLVERRPFARLDAQWIGIPRVETLRLDRLEAMRGRINGLPRAVEARLADDRFVVVDRELSAVLGRIDRSALVSRGGVLLTTLQFAILAGYAVLLVGAILAERRRPEVALLRARGASTPEIGLIAVGEAAVLSLPAVAIAPWLALLIVEGIGRWGAFGDSGIIAGASVSPLTGLVALVGGLACLVALTAPALVAEVDLARVRAALGRPLAQTAAQRLGLDLVLLVVAVIGLAQLNAYGGTLTGTADGGLGLDPLLVAAPAIAFAAGAVLVVRLVPRVGGLAEWLLRRGRGAVLPYSARQAARRPLRYTRSALLIVLAVALGTFGAVYSTTWTRSQQDQAAHQAGADLRVSRAQQARATPAVMAEALERLPGVEHIAPLARIQLDAGRQVPSTALLAVDPESVLLTSRAAGTTAAEWQASLEELVATRRPPGSIALPADARRLAITLDVELEAIELFGRPPIEAEDWNGVAAAPVVGPRAEEAQPLPEQRAGYVGSGQRLVYDLAHDGANGVDPLQLTAVQLAIGAPSPTVGRLELVSISTSASVSGDADWQPLVEPWARQDWSFSFTRLGETPPFGWPTIVPGDEFDGPVIVADDQHSLPACGTWASDQCAGSPHVYRWAPRGAAQQLPVVASRDFMAATGSVVGDSVAAYAGTDVVLRLIGVLDSFPSTDPAVPFVIADLGTLNQLRDARQLTPLQASEWWLAVDDRLAADISERALAEPIGAQQVVSRDELTRSLQRDPIALGMVGALLLGSLTAAGFAVVALLVGAVVSAREQLGELALMRALGVSRRQVVGLLAIEHGFLLGLGVVAGTALGLLIAVLVVPHAPLNRSGEPVVPAAQIVVPWEVIGLVGLAAAGLVALSVLVAAREIGRRPAVDVLREREA
jgi:hypothetical protein